MQTHEEVVQVRGGWTALWISIVSPFLLAWMMYFIISSAISNGFGMGHLIGIIVFSLLVIVWSICLAGFYTLQPNESAVLVLFGRYVGTDKTSGFRWANPFYKKIKVSLRARNLNMDVIKVNDLRGNPIEIAAVVVWKVSNTAEASQWFERTFPDSMNAAVGRTLDEEDFWSLLTEKLQQTPIEGIPLLKDMRYADAKRVLHTGSTLQCKRGDRIVQAGATSREMYVILSGSVEVRSGDHVVAELGRGEIFGESALISSAPRTADVVALEDVEVLILSQNFLENGMRTMPEIMSRVLYNLSMILVERLRDSTTQLTDGSAAAIPATKQDQRRSA